MRLRDLLIGLVLVALVAVAAVACLPAVGGM